MGPQYEHFRFEIGHFVQQRICADFDNRKMIVLERIYQECPGGVQIHYECRAQREIVQQYLEIELEEYKPDVLMSDAEIEARLMQRMERRKWRESKVKEEQEDSKPASDESPAPPAE